MKAIVGILLACLASAADATTVVSVPYAPPLPAVDPAHAVAFPDWLPATVRGTASGGTTNVLGMAAEWVLPPPPGRPGVVAVSYSNLLDQAVLVAGLETAAGTEEGAVLCLALETGGIRRPVAGFPGYGSVGPDETFLAAGRAIRFLFRLPPEVPSGAAGSEGLVIAYAARQEQDQVVHWAESAPLPVPAAAPEPGVAGTNEWVTLRAYWLARGVPGGGPGGMHDVLSDFPELARFFPGVVLDAMLPEAFRLEFAKRIPGVDAYDPGVLALIQNAPDKDAPLVIAALNVLRRSRGGTPEEGAVRDTVDGIVYAMSLDPQLPLLFRLHAAHTFPVQSWYLEFMARTEPEFKLISAHGIREYDIEEYTEAKRNTIRAGLTPLLDNNTAFVAGPLQGQFPENVTIGQAAQSLLGQFEERWTANPPPE